MSDVLKLAESQDLATRILVAIEREHPHETGWSSMVMEFDRERIESDLAGLREHRDDGFHPNLLACERCGREWPCPDAQRYVAGLRRTAALYAVSP